MNYADNMLQGMMPSLDGLRVDLVTVCTVMISLTIVVICFYVLYEILWVPYKVQVKTGGSSVSGDGITFSDLDHTKHVVTHKNEDWR